MQLRELITKAFSSLTNKTLRAVIFVFVFFSLFLLEISFPSLFEKNTKIKP